MDSKREGTVCGAPNSGSQVDIVNAGYESLQRKSNLARLTARSRHLFPTKEATLYGFPNGEDGGHPVSGVGIDATGILYGVASSDGGEFLGVYQLKP